MKGRVLAIITAILFGATMAASPVVFAAAPADSGAAITDQKPAKKKSTKKKATKKKASKAKSKKKATKKADKAA